jgi:hypothetical protein
LMIQQLFSYLYSSFSGILALIWPLFDLNTFLYRFRL